MNTLIKTARDYHLRGFSVIPLKSKSKVPAISSWRQYQKRKPTNRELHEWFKNNSYNIGLITGQISGLCVIDADSDNAKKITDNFPDTPKVKTAKGFHFYFAYKKGIKNAVRFNGADLDIRANGGYVVAPPSVHPTGKRYDWVKGKNINNTPLAVFPEILSKSNERSKKPLKELYRGVPEGKRNDSLARIIGSMIHDGVSFNNCLEFAHFWNSKNKPPEGDKKKIERTVRSIFERHQKSNEASTELVTFSASDLDKEELTEPSFIVAGIIPEGVTLICGKAKQGKSIFALNCAVAITTGAEALGRAEVKQGDVLGFFLEDTKKSLKLRFDKILQYLPKPKNLHIFLEPIKLGGDGLTRLNNWLDGHPDTRLVIIDTFQKVRPNVTGKSPLYQEDYNSVAGLKKVADERGISILIIHHLRKMKAEDILDTVSGTTGLTGSADNILVLTRSRGRADATLRITGRNIEEKELALEFNPTSLRWTVLGDAEEFRMTTERSEIFNLLKNYGGAMTPKEIAKKLGKNRNTVRVLLNKMIDENQIKLKSRGKYIYHKHHKQGNRKSNDVYDVYGNNVEDLFLKKT